MRRRAFIRFILVGLIISSSSIPLPAQTPQPNEAQIAIQALSSWKTKRPTQQEIKSVINNLKKITKQFKRIKTLITVSAIGVTGLAIGATIALGTLVLAGLIRQKPKTITTTEGTFITTILDITQTQAVIKSIKKLAPIIITGIIIAIISGSAAGGSSLFAVVTGGLPAPQIITSVDAVETVQNIKKKYPGILTQEQITIVEKFKQTIRGPIRKGIITGINLNKARKMIARKALKQQPHLAMKLEEKKAKKVIEKYLQIKREATNLQLNIQAHKEAKEKHSIEVNYPIKKTKAETFRAAIVLSFLKFRLKWYKNKLKKFRKQYPGTEKRLEPFVKEYNAKADAITSKLSEQLAKVATTKKEN